MKALHTIAFILVVIGGLNWGLVGISPSYDLVAMIGNATSTVVSTIVYILVGLSALYLIVTHKSSCKHCESGSSSQSM
jgi:hypothetical protein